MILASSRPRDRQWLRLSLRCSPAASRSGGWPLALAADAPEPAPVAYRARRPAQPEHRRGVDLAKVSRDRYMTAPWRTVSGRLAWLPSPQRVWHGRACAGARPVWALSRTPAPSFAPLPNQLIQRDRNVFSRSDNVGRPISWLADSADWACRCRPTGLIDRRGDEDHRPACD